MVQSHRRKARHVLLLTQSATSIATNTRAPFAAGRRLHGWRLSGHAGRCRDQRVEMRGDSYNAVKLYGGRATPDMVAQPTLWLIRRVRGLDHHKIFSDRRSCRAPARNCAGAHLALCREAASREDCQPRLVYVLVCRADIADVSRVSCTASALRFLANPADLPHHHSCLLRALCARGTPLRHRVAVISAHAVFPHPLL